MEVKVSGVDDLQEALSGLVPKLRIRALRNGLAAGARIVQKAARAATPVLNPASPMVRKGYRTSGLVRKQLSVRTSKEAKRKGDVGVFVNVKPAKGSKFRSQTKSVLGLKYKVRNRVRVGSRGAKSPLDPYYWKFINFGTLKGTKAFRFLERGAERLPQALQAFIRTIGPQIEKLNKPKAPAP